MVRSIFSVSLVLLGLSAGTATALLPLHEATYVVAVNLHEATNAGCSDDYEPGFLGYSLAADFQARVWWEGRVVHTTDHTRDAPHGDWFDLVEFEVPSLPATVAIEVREAEPGPRTEDPTWIVCDLTPEEGRWLNVTIPRDAAVTFDSQGGSALSARVIGRAGPGALPHPRPALLFAREPSKTCIHLQWETHPEEPPTTRQLLQRHAREGQEVPPRERAFDWCGLREGERLGVRLLREWEGWRVAHRYQEFSTTPPDWTPSEGGGSAPASPPRPPPPPWPEPEVSVAAGLDEVVVSWSAPKGSILVEVYASSMEEFRPGPRTLRWEGTEPTGNVTLPAPAHHPYHVVVVAHAPDGRSSNGKGSATPGERPPPPAPEPPVVESVHAGLRVTWAPPAVAGVAWHDVLVARAGEPPSVAARVPIPLLEAEVTGVAPGEEVLVGVRAVNHNGHANASAQTPHRHAPPNAPPLLEVNVSPRVPVGVPLALDVRASDPDGDAVEVAVEWGDGAKGMGTRLSHAYTQPGLPTILVRARDAFGAETTRLVPVEVAPDEPPVARFEITPVPAKVALTVFLDPSGSHDPEGGPLSLRVDWGDGVVENVSGVASHVYATAGEHAVTLVAVDASGGEDRHTRLLRVEDHAPRTGPSSGRAQAEGARAQEEAEEEEAGPGGPAARREETPGAGLGLLGAGAGAAALLARRRGGPPTG